MKQKFSFQTLVLVNEAKLKRVKLEGKFRRNLVFLTSSLWLLCCFIVFVNLLEYYFYY